MAKRRRAGRSGTKEKGAKRDLPVQSADKIKGGAAIAMQSQTAALEILPGMQRENQVFTSVSNVLKTTHDVQNNSIDNAR